MPSVRHKYLRIFFFFTDMTNVLEAEPNGFLISNENLCMLRQSDGCGLFIVGCWHNLDGKFRLLMKLASPNWSPLQEVQ